MSISFGVAAGATLVALVLTGMLVQRCVRVPRLDLAALACAGVGMTVALAVQALGFDKGFGATTFRALHLGAQLLAPMALAWALAEMTGKSLGSRFAARLALGGLTMVCAVVLASDPLSAAAFTTNWPAASVFYQLIPNAILELVAGVTVLAAVVAVIVAAVRARRYPGWHDLFGPVVVVAIAALATDGLRIALPVKTAYAGVCVFVVALAWFAGRLSSRVRLDVLRLGGPVWNEDTGEFVRYNEDTGEFAPYRDEDYGHGQPGGGYRSQGPDGGYVNGAQGGYPQGGDPGWSGGDDTGGVQPEGGDADFDDWFRDDTGGGRPDAGGGRRDAPSQDYGRYGPDAGYGRTPGHEVAPNGRPGGFETGDMLAAPGGYRSDGYQGLGDGYQPDGRAPQPDTSRLYGQIAIYTLLDGSVDDFDLLARHVVEQVNTGEPGTMIYVMHGVPSAPMQRILYEVYQDEAAFEAHIRQPYVQRFEEERKPYVLATNVIELGVRFAMFAPGAMFPPAAMPQRAAPPAPMAQRPVRGEARPWGNSSR
jgi:quinol monooxygenase YgiN